MNKKLYYGLLGVMLLATFACAFLFFGHDKGDVDHYDKNMNRIVFVSPQKSLPVWLRAKQGFCDAAKEYGFYAEWLGSNDCDLDEMNRQISIAIFENVDAIITCPLTPSAFDEVLLKASEEEIPVITVAVDASQAEMRNAFIGPDYKKIGLDQSKALHSRVQGAMKIGVIMSTFDSQNQIIQVNELKKYIEALPDSEIVAMAEDYANPVTGLSIFTDMLEEHPEINAVFVTSGDAISSYGKILAEKNLQDKITLIGMDAIDANLQSIQKGEIYGVMEQDFYQMGYLGGEYAAKLLQGNEVPKETFCESKLVTRENAAEIIKLNTAEAP